MFRAFLLPVVSIMSVTASAQSVTLHGKVSNKNGNPVAGAIVTVVNSKTSDTTDAKGLFSFSIEASANPTQSFQNGEAIIVHNGILSLRLFKQAPVKIEIFATPGNLLEKVENSSMPSGIYRFEIMAHRFAAQMMMIRVSVGNRVSLVRYMPLGEDSRPAASALPRTENAERLAKTHAAIDSLRVSANGYLRVTSPISSYQDSVNFTLDTLSLAKFSFFVTSLKALRDLSNNPLGFGGDLRFGKTGPGAGLLGADSICQCIAERSMPGSKIKLWRAFLSVAAGPGGTQINAIDRIEPGPWYDRRGRVVALNVNDLLNNHPLNSDAAIKNDLPNEDGVPNHQPDPNQPAVDNHLTITGSDSTGRLYAATSTCEDWTNATTTTASKPRCGLSWTRTGFGSHGGMGKSAFMTNMQNWISSWDLPGCVAGVDSTDRSGAGDPNSKSIGAGGGYGGFYCFGLNP